MTVMNMIQALNSAMDVMLARDANVLIFGEDVGFFGGVFRVTDGLQQRYGEQRVFDAPIAESGQIAVAIGMGAYGLRPVVECQFADYIYPAFDQLVSEAARLRYRSAGEFNAPITVRDREAATADVENLGAALAGKSAAGGFLTAASPGVVAIFQKNEYYPSDAAYLEAVAEALRHEYEAIVAEGFLLQIDSPDLAMGRHLIPGTALSGQANCQRISMARIPPIMSINRPTKRN